MASAPTPNLPLFYNDLMPLNLRDHENWRSRTVEEANWLVHQHAVPVTVDEFTLAQRHFPIIFSGSDNPVPLALFGLNEGVNVYVDEKGKLIENIYLPAYIRRYPFILARLDSENDTMSLCFDPSAGILGEFDEGPAIFEEGQPSPFTQEVMQFCERFEQAGQRTQTFVDELIKHELLMDGEVAIQRHDAEPDEQPYVYRGFKMINQDKLRELRGDLLRTWNQNGMLNLIFAQILSLDMLRVIFGAQTAQGKGPGAEAAAKAAAAAPAN